MNNLLKKTVVAGGIVLATATGAFAQRAGGDGDQPAPHCCDTPTTPTKPGKTVNKTYHKSVSKTKNINIPIAIAPDPAVTSAICGRSRSVTAAVGIASTPLSVSGGFATADPVEDCIRLVTLWHGAENGHCMIAAAAGIAAIDRVPYVEALRLGAQACGMRFSMPRNKGG